jgi:hypothetical protein
MPKPTEHKTVQARILAYAQEIGWSLVTREEAERRKGIGDLKLDIWDRRDYKDETRRSAIWI